jgi:hypothetical protein
MSEYDGEAEPTRDVIVAHDFEHPERVGATETHPLSVARRMVHDGQARYADQPEQPVPDWYRKVYDLPGDTAPEAETPAVEVPPETPVDAQQDPPPRRTRKPNTAEE